MTKVAEFDLTLNVSSVAVTPLSAEQLREVDAWIGAHLTEVPESVAVFLTLHRHYLNAGEDLRRRFNETLRQLRRALGIICSSERRRSGSPLSAVPGAEPRGAETARERLEQQKDRCLRLGGWHEDLQMRHTSRAQRIVERLAKMKTEPSHPAPAKQDKATEPASLASLEEVTEDTPLEEIELTEQERAESHARAVELAEHMEKGEAADPALTSVSETLMPGGAAVTDEEMQHLAAILPAELAGAKVVKTLSDERTRYDVSVAVNPTMLKVQKLVVVKDNGERTVVSASTDPYGPPRYSVTWSTLATLAVLVGQFALPLNRLATLFSTAAKKFTAGGLSRMLHYVAERLVPIYIELCEQLSDSDILSGDDTSCRVIEVASYFNTAKAKAKKQSGSQKKRPPPWEAYRTPTAAQASIEQCRERQELRRRRRADGDRQAKRTKDEDPSLGMLIGRVLGFESPRQDGTGGKQSLNTTVITGRSVAEDPRSQIVFYRSQLGSFGNLLESVLAQRRPAAGDLIVQADLSSTNLVRDPELLQRFAVKLIGCSSHARRPFALYEHEDPVYCPFMLHQFTGLAMHEQLLDEYGRNRDNVLAVRQADSRRLWDKIKELATTMVAKWSKSTKLGAAARYILKHYDKLTAYLDDPRLQSTNNLQERMLRTEKLIEKSSLFRLSLEGRFVLDIIRTIQQTAVAARVPVVKYLVFVLRTNPLAVQSHPERFTPYAWAAENLEGEVAPPV